MKFNDEIAIGLNTFLRDDSLKRFISSCRAYYPEIRIYIVDQDKQFSQTKKKFYSYLKSEGHQILKIPYDCGISYAREALRKFVKEPYMMYMQDDFIVCPETNIYGMYEILRKNKDIGVVCGSVTTRKTRPFVAEIPQKAHGYFLQKIDNRMVYLPIQYLLDLELINYEKVGNMKYVICDMALDFSFWRRGAQEGIFDENVHVLEHTHVYLNLQKRGKYKVAYTPNSIIVHTHDRACEEYTKMRMRKEDVKYLHEYWNIKDFVVLEGKELFPPVQKLVDIKETNAIAVTETHSILQEFETILKSFNKEIVLAKETCLQAVINHKLNSIDLHLFVSQLSADEIQYLASKKFYYVPESSSFIKNNHRIYTFKLLHGNTKYVDIENKKYKVPLPVHGYLEKTFGDDWYNKGKNTDWYNRENK